MKTIIMRKRILMSLAMGMLMGLTFSIINQLKQNGSLQPVGIVVGMLISMVASTLFGLTPLGNMKVICDTVLGRWLGLDTFDPKKKLLFYIGESMVGAILYTPVNMFFNQFYGMYMGMKMGNTFPPFATDFMSQAKFIFSGPFWPAFGHSILPSILIGIPISLVGTIIFGRITDKICGI